MNDLNRDGRDLACDEYEDGICLTCGEPEEICKENQEEDAAGE